MAKRLDDNAYFIVAKEKSVDNYARKLSDHRPVLMRLSLMALADADRGGTADTIDREIEELLKGRT